MTNDDLNQIKVELANIANNTTQLVHQMNAIGDKLHTINNEEQPEEFKEIAVEYSAAKNQLTSYLLNIVDLLGLTLLDVIEYVQSTPKAKLWVPEGSRG